MFLLFFFFQIPSKLGAFGSSSLPSQIFKVFFLPKGQTTRLSRCTSDERAVAIGLKTFYIYFESSSLKSG